MCCTVPIFYERNDMIQGHLLDTSNMVIGCVEIFLERSKKQNHLQKRVFWGKFRTHFLRSILKKSGVFTFPFISFDWCVVLFRFFYERNDMIQGTVLGSSSIQFTREIYHRIFALLHLKV